MQQRMRRSGIIIRLLSLGLLAGVALTASPATAVDITGPYYPEPAWAMKLAPAARFGVLTNWNSEAVLDRETGLVWERTPNNNIANWDEAIEWCRQSVKGGRSGWRLPTIFELASLIDPSVTLPGPALPPGHPFLKVEGATAGLGNYWSATWVAPSPSDTDPFAAWHVYFGNGNLDSFPRNIRILVWCVRGGLNTAPAPSLKAF